MTERSNVSSSNLSLREFFEAMVRQNGTGRAPLGGEEFYGKRESSERLFFRWQQGDGGSEGVRGGKEAGKERGRKLGSLPLSVTLSPVATEGGTTTSKKWATKAGNKHSKILVQS